MKNFWLRPGGQDKCMRCLHILTLDIICPACKKDLAKKFPNMEWEEAFMREVDAKKSHLKLHGL